MGRSKRGKSSFVYHILENRLEFLGLIHMGSQVPSPIHVSESQHGGKVPTFEPQETIKIWLSIIKVGSWSFYAKTFTGLVLRVGSSFLFNPPLNTTPKAHLQIMSCVAMWASMSYLGLKTWDPVWSGKSQLSCSQATKIAQIDLKWLGTQDLEPLWTGP